MPQKTQLRFGREDVGDAQRRERPRGRQRGTRDVQVAVQLHALGSGAGGRPRVGGA